MLPDRVSNPGPLTYESGALPIALRGPAISVWNFYKTLTNNIVSFEQPGPGLFLLFQFKDKFVQLSGLIYNESKTMRWNSMNAMDKCSR